MSIADICFFAEVGFETIFKILTLHCRHTSIVGMETTFFSKSRLDQILDLKLRMFACHSLFIGNYVDWYLFFQLPLLALKTLDTRAFDPGNEGGVCTPKGAIIESIRLHDYLEKEEKM